MYKIFKIVLLGCFVFNSASVSAQVSEYLADENSRISKSQETENEIRRFVDDNFKNYKLSKETTDEVIKHLREEEEFTEEELQKALVNAKIYELRKLFFFENSE